MNRRSLLIAIGGIGLTASAGCISDDDEEGEGDDDVGIDTGETLGGDEDDEYGTHYDAEDVDGDTGVEGEKDGYRTYVHEGTAVRLAPIDEVYEWYQTDDELIVVDARPPSQFEESHIEGAVSSPFPDGLESEDPLEGVEKDRRIVTYCVCPHVQAGIRAASLIEDGYTDVYALDEGYAEWVERGYPLGE